jgi:phage terminase large subunit-like protein
VTAAPQIGLLDACDDRDLFGVELWPRQRKILEQIDSGAYREVVLALGRRSGKNLMAALAAVHDAAFRDLRRYLRKGERRYIVVVAAGREQSGLTLQFVRELVGGSELLSECVESDTEESITIRQPHTDALVVIKTIPCSARTGRGLAISTLVFDEMAHWLTDGEGPAVADRVYRALSPSVAQFQAEARIIAISTPCRAARAPALLRVDHVPARRAEGGDPQDARAPLVGVHGGDVRASRR